MKVKFSHWAVVSGVIIGLATVAQAQDAAVVVRDTKPGLTVTGNGEVAAAPDRATVRLGAEVQAANASEAQAQVNDIVQRTLQQVKAVGVEERKIQTSGISLFPVYAPQQFKPNEQPEAPRIVAYRASNTVQVEVNNLALIGKVIDAGVAAGANRVEGVSFSLENDLTARVRALQQAVAEARDKAAAMAGALGVRLVEVSDVTEGSVNVIAPMPRLGVMMARADAAATPVQPGEMRIQASVTLHYHIAAK